jgi:hypothetical protein
MHGLNLSLVKIPILIPIACETGRFGSAEKNTPAGSFGCEGEQSSAVLRDEVLSGIQLVYFSQTPTELFRAVHVYSAKSRLDLHVPISVACGARRQAAGFASARDRPGGSPYPYARNCWVGISRS